MCVFILWPYLFRLSGQRVRILRGTPAGSRPLVRPRRRWEDNFRMEIK